jgi:hypothetical protein
MALGIPKDQIRYIVDKLHVGESDEKVRALIRMRTAPHPGWTQARVKQAETYALKVHHDNQKMYAYVMGGSAGWRAGAKRRNPSRRKTRKRRFERPLFGGPAPASSTMSPQAKAHRRKVRKAWRDSREEGHRRRR